MWQFSITYNSITTVVSEPIGWNETEIVIRRNKEFHGIFFEYSLNKLRYHGTAYTILKDAYETLGIDAEAELLIEYKCDDSDTFEEFYTGKFAFNQIKIEEGNGCFIEIPIEQIGCVNTFLNRKDQKVNLNSNLDFNEDALTAYAGLNESLAFPEKEIFLKTEFSDGLDIDNLQGSIAQQDFFWFYTIGFENVVAEDIHDYDTLQYAIFGGVAGTLDFMFNDNNGIITLVPQSTYIAAGNYNINITLDADIFEEAVADIYAKQDRTLQIFVTLLQTNSSATVIKYFNNLYDSGVQVLNANDTFSDNVNINFSNTFTCQENDRFYLFYTVKRQFTSGGLNQVYLSKFKSTVNESSFSIDTLSLFQSTSSKVAYINEALSRTVEAITNDCIRVKSDYYGRTNSLPYSSSIDGCGGLRIITDGLNIRKKLLSDGTVPPITVSFDDMMNGLNPIDNIGYGIEDDPNRAGFKQLRVEPFDYFYDSSTSITLRKVPAIETTVDESRIYSQINIGYEKWESEEFNGLDEINTNRTYRTVLNSVKNTLTKISSFITSGYALEITRRNGTNSNDWRFDNDIFLVQLRRVGIGTFVEFFNTAQLLFANLLTPNTTYNIRLSPIRNLIRWFPIIQSSWSKQATSPIELKYTDGTANIKAETQILVNGCTAELNTFLLSESRNISKNDLLGVIADPLWEPEQIKFEFPLSYQQFKTLRQFPYKKIKILGNFGDRSGWIEQINYKPNTGIATFTLLKQYGS